MNRIVIYLYRNFNYGKRPFSKSMLFLAKITYVSIILLWLCSALVLLDRRMFDENLLSFIKNDTGLFFYCVAFISIMYLVLNKHFVTLEEAETMLSDIDNDGYINNTKLILWAIVLLPLLVVLVSGSNERY